MPGQRVRASPRRRVAAGASSQQRPRSVATRRSAAAPASRLAPDAAAVRIQATYRGYETRRCLADGRAHLDRQATLVQSRFRGYKARQEQELRRVFSPHRGPGGLRLPPASVPAAGVGAPLSADGDRSVGAEADSERERPADTHGEAAGSAALRVPVEVPEGLGGGDVVTVERDRQAYEVTIPEGLRAGDQFDALVSAAPRTPHSGMSPQAKRVLDLRARLEAVSVKREAHRVRAAEQEDAREAAHAAAAAAAAAQKRTPSRRAPPSPSVQPATPPQDTHPSGSDDAVADAERPPATTDARVQRPPQATPPRLAPEAAAWMATPARAGGLAANALSQIFDGIRSEAQAMAVFSRIDRDKSGTLDISEFQRALKLLQFNLTEKQVWLIMNELDDDGDEEVSVEEFLSRVRSGKVDALRKIFRAAAYSTGVYDLRELFEHLDKAKTGVMRSDDFRRIARKEAKVPVTSLADDELQGIYASLEGGESKLVTAERFVAVLALDEAGAQRERHASVSGQAMGAILRSAAAKKINLMYLVNRHDTNETGELNAKQLGAALRELGIELDRSGLEELVEDLDTDGDGNVSIAEFARRLRVAKRDARAGAAAEGEPPATPVRKTPRRSKPSGTPVAMGSARASAEALPTPLPTNIGANRSLHSAGPLRKTFQQIFEGIGSQDQALRVFSSVDRDKGGSLDFAEFQRALRLLNLHVTEKHARLIMDELDQDGDGQLDIEEFMRVVREGKLEKVRTKFRAASYHAGVQDWAKLFAHYDRDQSGTLGFDDFRRAVRRDAKISAASVGDDELKDVFASVDLDGSGSIDADEFTALLDVDVDPEAMHAEAHERDQTVAGKAMHRIIEQASERKDNLMYRFHRWASCPGELSSEEFGGALSELGVGLDAGELQALVHEIDTDGDGKISIAEFAHRLRQAKRDILHVTGVFLKPDGVHKHLEPQSSTPPEAAPEEHQEGLDWLLGLRAQQDEAALLIQARYRQWSAGRPQKPRAAKVEAPPPLPGHKLLVSCIACCETPVAAP